MLDNHWYLCIATLPDVFNRLKDAVAPSITHSIINSLVIVFSKTILFHSQALTLVASLLQFSLLLVHVSAFSSMYHLNTSKIKPLTMVSHHRSTYQHYCWYVDIWWDIMVSSLILLVFRWYILEKAETWTKSKENWSSDATSVYTCEWNKMLLENTIRREFISEWVINRATVSLSLLNTSDSVAMHRYQWLSNTYAWHYMFAFTTSHTQDA